MIIKTEFDDLLNKISDEQFWIWVSGWFDVDFIMDIINNWDEETKKEEIINLKEILKNDNKTL